MLGDAHRRADEPVARALVAAARSCQVVPETGEIVRYRSFAEEPVGLDRNRPRRAAVKDAACDDDVSKQADPVASRDDDWPVEDR